MIRKLYDWVMGLAGSRQAPIWLAIISFAESSVFPIPPDVMLAPMIVKRPERAWLYAGICTIASVLGGMLGYAIGYFLKPVGIKILAFWGKAEDIEKVQRWYDQWGNWVILGKGLTPIPFKLVTIASGALEYAFLPFLVCCIITRGGRFFIEAALIKKFGPAIMPVVEKRLTLFTVLFVILLVGGFVALKFLH